MRHLPLSLLLVLVLVSFSPAAFGQNNPSPVVGPTISAPAYTPPVQVPPVTNPQVTNPNVTPPAVVTNPNVTPGLSLNPMLPNQNRFGLIDQFGNPYPNVYPNNVI